MKKILLITIPAASLLIAAIGTPLILGIRASKSSQQPIIKIDSSEIDFNSWIIKNSAVNVLDFIKNENIQSFKNGVLNVSELEFNEKSLKIENYVNEALGYVEKNGFDDSFFTKFIPDVNIDEIKKDQEKYFTNNLQMLDNHQKIISENEINSFSFKTHQEKLFGILDLDKLDEGLEIAHITFTTASVAAGIISAGFWAAAWFWGFSIPAAIASSAASIGLAGIAFGLKGFHNLVIAAKKEVFDLGWMIGTTVLDAASIGSAVVGLIGMIKVPLIATIVGGQALMSFSSWSIPALLGVVLPTFLGVLALMDYFNVI